MRTCEDGIEIAGNPANESCNGPCSPGLGGVAVSLLVLRRELGAAHACLASLTSLPSAASGCASFSPAEPSVVTAQDTPCRLPCPSNKHRQALILSDLQTPCAAKFLICRCCCSAIIDCIQKEAVSSSIKFSVSRGLILWQPSS